MRFDGPDRWVVLRVVSKEDGTFAYRDDRGTSLKFSLRHDAAALKPVDDALRESLALTASAFTTLPLFIEDRTDPLSLFPTARRLTKAFPLLEQMTGWQLVFSLAPPAAYGRYTLPLDIVTVGDDAQALLSTFTQHSFFLEGVVAGSISITHLPSPAKGLGRLDPDIVITGGDDAELLLTTTRPGSGPRLVVLLRGPRWFEDTDLFRDVPKRRWTHGTAVIALSRRCRTPEVIDSLLMAIVHDTPLHQWRAEKFGRWSETQTPLIIADPFTNHGLRMSDAFAAEARQDLESAIGARPPAASIREVAFDVRDDEEGEPSDTDDDRFERSTVSFYGPGTKGVLADRSLDLRFNFDRESDGLTPLSLARQRRTRARGLEAAVPALTADLSEQRRRVDARIERVERVDLIDRYAAAAQALWVGCDRTLRRAARYRLRIQIGKSFAGNLIPDEIADLLLPPSPEELWDLDVVVFAKDFALGSPPLQRLRLPKSGASEALYFDLTAPASGDQAQLRFGIYLGNQLLQSFVLDAALDDAERKRADGLKVRLDFARSDVFANLDALRPRAASIGVNLDATPDSHTLLVKVGDVVEGIPLTGAALDLPVRKLRGVLSAAAAKGNEAVFPAQEQPLTAAQRAKFEETVRGLATIGGELHDALFVRASAQMKMTLRQIMRSADQPILLPRLDPNLAIPWAVLYDFVVPAGTPAICDGTVEGKPCGHGPGAPVICVNGFWGIRHVLDEQLPLGRRDAVPAIARPEKGAVVRTSDGVGGGFCSDMNVRLNTALGDGTVTTVADDEDVVEILWNQRPAIMLILGHLDEANPPEIPRRRIKTAGKSEWLIDSDIISRNKLDGDWAQPNALVLLMACEAMQMTSTTLTDHALAISSAGAALVIGPECPIFPAFACWFTEELILSLLRGRTSAGRAISDFRRRLIHAGNPLGFGFTAFGDADVTIA